MASKLIGFLLVSILVLAMAGASETCFADCYKSCDSSKNLELCEKECSHECYGRGSGGTSGKKARALGETDTTSGDELAGNDGTGDGGLGEDDGTSDDELRENDGTGNDGIDQVSGFDNGIGGVVDKSGGVTVESFDTGMRNKFDESLGEMKGGTGDVHGH